MHVSTGDFDAPLRSGAEVVPFPVHLHLLSRHLFCSCLHVFAFVPAVGCLFYSLPVRFVRSLGAPGSATFSPFSPVHFSPGLHLFSIFPACLPVPAFSSFWWLPACCSRHVLPFRFPVSFLIPAALNPSIVTVCLLY